MTRLAARISLILALATCAGVTYAEAPPPCHAAAAAAAAGDDGGAAIKMSPGMDMSAPCHSMAGIPRWMFFGGGLFLLLGTALVTGSRQRWPLSSSTSPSRSWDLLAWPPLRRLIKKPWFPLLLQTPGVLVFALVVVAGLLGATYTNIAPVFTWTVWWGLLVFVVLLFGKAFCAICPWDALAGIAQRGSLFARRQPLRTLGKKWPRWARNIWPATILFIGLTWLELGFGVTRNAPATAVLGLLMLALTVASALVFERRAFCRYGCLVGRISGLYAMFSPVELRPRDADTCSACSGKDCGTGNALAMACPTFEFPGALSRNTYCTLCTECVRACPHDNIALRARPFGKDLRAETRFKSDEANLAMILLALTSFHGLTMTPTWYLCTDAVQAFAGVGYKVAFSILMAACIVLPLALFWGIAWLGDKLTHARLGTFKVYCAFAFPLVPIALFYHVAHNVMHFFREGQMLLPRLSDPFGWRWDLFGTAHESYGAMLSLDSIWILQTGFILTGHIFGIVFCEGVARTLYSERRDARRVQIPMLVVMILFSLYSLWLIHQPMEMRTGL